MSRIISGKGGEPTEIVTGREPTEEIPQPKRGITVAVCIPSHDQCSTLFAYDLAKMMGYLGSSAVASGEIEAMAINLVTGTYVSQARQELAERALQDGVDWTLWLDADMRFPKDTLIRLLNRGKPIVGINYSMRGLPPDYVAIKETGTEERSAIRCATTSESEGVEEVAAVGFGALLVHTSVFANLHDPKGPEGPWFMWEWLDSIKRGRGEDVRFCQLARDAGYPVFVDHDLSKECEHIGTFSYKLEHVEAFKAGEA